jgi:hypothetical protein
VSSRFRVIVIALLLAVVHGFRRVRGRTERLYHHAREVCVQVFEAFTAATGIKVELYALLVGERRSARVVAEKNNPQVGRDPRRSRRHLRGGDQEGVFEALQTRRSGRHPREVPLAAEFWTGIGVIPLVFLTTVRS